ncbi:hypothetical protein Misp06_02716 [Microbulbifer sp. NBRC 101763]|uniref:hypothetical protein n=1 Tax=Microbulbifer sp. NBRC 101763 TaxID=1113820 RepID=UPI0030A5F563
MLERLQNGNTTKYDIEFYLHELKESAQFRKTGELMPAHERALKWRNVESLDLFTQV